MALAKRKPEPAPDLTGEILRLRGQIERFIDAKVMQAKQTRDGQSMPIEQLRMMLTRGQSCLCAAAIGLLADESR
jgi:hypothetical protein